MGVMTSPPSKPVRKWEMITESFFTAPVSQLRSWSFISEIAGYAQWHPHYRFSRLNGQATQAQFSFRLFDWRRVRLWVEVDHIDKPQSFGWRGRVSGLFIFSERYEILPAEAGSQVHHVVEIRGVLGNMVGWLVRRAICEAMQEHDFALLQALKKRASKTPRGGAQLKLVPDAPSRRSAND